jgi:hypothetical protein
LGNAMWSAPPCALSTQVNLAPAHKLTRKRGKKRRNIYHTHKTTPKSYATLNIAANHYLLVPFAPHDENRKQK